MGGTLKKIWVKRMKKGPMDPVDYAELIQGSGLKGNADQRGKRQVTLLDQDVWERLMEDLDAALDPSVRRANLMLEGIDLKESRGKILKLGGCVIEIYGETKPCHQMDEALPGLKKAMYDDWKGGAFGTVLSGGEIRTGDTAEWVSEQTTAGSG